METTFVREVTVQYRGARKKVLEGIREPKGAAVLFRKLFPDNSREHFIALYLNGAHQVVSYSVISTGNAVSCPVHCREVFQAAIMSGAVAIIAAHNHPSDVCEPSEQDRQITKRLKDAGDLLGIKLLDHLVVTETNFYSFQQGGLI